MSLKDQTITEIAKAAPPVSVAGLTGNEVLVALSIVYVLLQTCHLLWKWNKERKANHVKGK